MFELLNIHALKDNYIWLLRKGAFAAVVDPGEASAVLEVLTREKLSLIAILVTHHHADHQGGIADLLVQYPAAAVYGPEKESITGLDHPLSGGETIVFPELEGVFQVLDVPGHTLGHIAYFSAEAGVLFCPLQAAVHSFSPWLSYRPPYLLALSSPWKVLPLPPLVAPNTPPQSLVP